MIKTLVDQFRNNTKHADGLGILHEIFQDSLYITISQAFNRVFFTF